MQMLSMKIKEPKLKKELFKEMPDGMEFSDTYFDEFPFSEVKDVTFDGCVFKRIDFSNVNLEDVSLTASQLIDVLIRCL